VIDMSKKEEGKKVAGKPDTLVKGGKKGDIELSEDQLGKVAGGSSNSNFLKLKIDGINKLKN
jgi:hypothetical protein